MIAANAPRRYVNRASRLGRDSLTTLPPSALATLPPLPYPEPSEAYLAEWNALMATFQKKVLEAGPDDWWTPGKRVFDTQWF